MPSPSGSSSSGPPPSRPQWQQPHMGDGSGPTMAERTVTSFFSPSHYRYGWIAAGTAAGYLVVTALLLRAATQEHLAGEDGDGSFLSGFVMVATAPLSFV